MDCHQFHMLLSFLMILKGLVLLGDYWCFLVRRRVFGNRLFHFYRLTGWIDREVSHNMTQAEN